jgi:predicted RNase H-like HicB family nuclease
MKQHIYNFSIIVEPDEDGYFVECPELQGCYAQGDSYEEAIENIKDVIKLHIEDRLASHEEIPQRRYSKQLSTIEVVT